MAFNKKACEFSEYDVKSAEIIERLIKRGWMNVASKASRRFPALFVTCIKMFVSEDPQLVRVFAELFVDSESKHYHMNTSHDLVAYIVDGAR